MDIYKFVVSNSIRNYLKKINYKFNTQEAAFSGLVLQNSNFRRKIFGMGRNY